MRTTAVRGTERSGVVVLPSTAGSAIDQPNVIVWVRVCSLCGSCWPRLRHCQVQKRLLTRMDMADARFQVLPSRVVLRAPSMQIPNMRQTWHSRSAAQLAPSRLSGSPSSRRNSGVRSCNLGVMETSAEKAGGNGNRKAPAGSAQAVGSADGQRGPGAGLLQAVPSILESWRCILVVFGCCFIARH